MRFSMHDLVGKKPFSDPTRQGAFVPLVAIPVFCCMVRALYLYTCTAARSSGEAERSGSEACETTE